MSLSQLCLLPTLPFLPPLLNRYQFFHLPLSFITTIMFSLFFLFSCSLIFLHSRLQSPTCFHSSFSYKFLPFSVPILSTTITNPMLSLFPYLLLPNFPSFFCLQSPTCFLSSFSYKFLPFSVPILSTTITNPMFSLFPFSCCSLIFIHFLVFNLQHASSSLSLASCSLSHFPFFLPPPPPPPPP